jgi:hypothetical protein
MAYSRQPQVVIANGGALKQTPPLSSTTPPGIVPVEIEALISTTTNLGVVQVGSGLSITPSGVLSATNSGSSIIAVTLTAVDYTALATDYYIGATKKDIEITLPLGIVGKVYYIKNQASGNIKVEGTGGQKLDTASSKTLGTEASIIVVFDGTRWNII